MIDVLVSGAAGRMGREVVKAVTAADGMRVVAAVDPGWQGRSIDDGSGGEVVCVSSIEEAVAKAASTPHVMVDFTRPDAVEANLRVATGFGMDCVIGTTGLATDTLRAIADEAPAGVCIFVAPNFAIGAILMMRFAEQASRFMPSAEIIELHHDKKLDAPSGTAMRTAALIAAARQEIVRAPGAETELPGGKGARGADVSAVRVHSVRLPGLVAHQEVLFGGQGQTLSIRHDSIDRTSFMPGVVLAIREVGAHSGLVVGLETFMDL